MRKTALFCAAAFAAGCFGSRSAGPSADEIKRRADAAHARMDEGPEALARQAAPPARPQPQAESKVKIKSQSAVEIVFESEGSGSASQYESLIVAQKRAEEDAVGAALRETGVDVFYGFSDLLAQGGGKEVQAVSRYVASFSRGAVSSRRLGEPECGLKGSFMECRVRIAGRIVKRGQPDPSFDILLNGEDLGLTHPAYREGQKVELGVRVSRDAALYIFSVDEEQNAFLVLPNKLWPQNRVKAGETFRYPPRQGGLEMVAALPEGKDKATEVLHIIATKGSPLLAVEGVAEKEMGPYKVLSAGSLGQVMDKLAKLDRDQWTMAVLPYEISR